MEATPPGMLANQRQQYILTEVNTHGGVRVSDLVETLEVSEMTIRRDIETLASSGALERVHGGAVSLAPTSFEPEFTAKRDRNRAEKQQIARQALTHITPGATVALSGGTTTAQIARAIAESPLAESLTILTNSLAASDILRQHCTLFLTGGEPTPSNALVGPLADLSCTHLHADVLFLGVHAMNQTSGLSTPNLHEAATMRAMIASSTRTIVAADASKWGMSGLGVIAPWSKAHTLITDSNIPPEARQFLATTPTRLEIITT